LLQVAFEWAADAAAPATDALFSFRPSAWVLIQAGGPDPLSMRLLQSAADAGIPCLVLDTDVDLADPFAAVAATAAIEIAVCADFEAEAQRTAAAVLDALNRDAVPIALIAQDRLLVRRVRALLARQEVPLQDETGWKLSTTRAAARVAGPLRASRGDSSCDDWLDWLKGCGADWPGVPGAGSAVAALERELRRRGWSHPSSVEVAALEAAPARLWQAATESIDRFRGARPQGLAEWLTLLGETLESCGAMAPLRDDEAGRQVLAALHLDGPLDAARRAVANEPMTSQEFADWVDGALEHGVFVPEAGAGAPVVVTPLERAMLRPFAGVVLAAADEKRLGAMPRAPALLGDALATALGVPTSAQRRDAETLAFAQALRAPRVALLRRVDDGGEPLAPSPLLERLELARLRLGLGALPALPELTVENVVPRVPVARPLPHAEDMLPERLSASACEALRTCPYRFFALRLLRLREAEELDDEFEKRDYGTWLHAVLHRFHANRGLPADAVTEEERLHEAAREVSGELRFDAAAFLPFEATFARFAPRYVEWLHARDASGARWLDGEVELTANPAEWAGIAMHGIVDRVDSVPGEGGTVTQLIDYKTGSAQALRDLMKQPTEDTQLPFYAALMAAQSAAGGPIGAAYVPLDESGPVRPIEHVDVEASAVRLVAGIGVDLARIRDGAALPALGEGRACSYCEARGLCRRDQWPATPTEP